MYVCMGDCICVYGHSSTDICIHFSVHTRFQIRNILEEHHLQFSNKAESPKPKMVRAQHYL